MINLRLNGINAEKLNIIKQCSKELEQLKFALKHVESLYQAEAKRVEALETEKAGVVADFKDKVTALISENEKLSKELQETFSFQSQFKASTATHAERNQTLAVKIDQLNHSLANEHSRNKMLEQDLSTSNLELESSRKQLYELKSEFATLKEKLLSFQLSESAALVDLQDTLSIVASERDDLKRKCETLSVSTSTLRDIKPEMARLNQLVVKLQASELSLNSALQDKQNVISQLTGERDELRRRYESGGISVAQVDRLISDRARIQEEVCRIQEELKGSISMAENSIKERDNMKDALLQIVDDYKVLKRKYISAIKIAKDAKDVAMEEMNKTVTLQSYINRIEYSNTSLSGLIPMDRDAVNTKQKAPSPLHHPGTNECRYVRGTSIDVPDRNKIARVPVNVDFASGRGNKIPHGAIETVGSSFNEEEFLLKELIALKEEVYSSYTALGK